MINRGGWSRAPRDTGIEKLLNFLNRNLRNFASLLTDVERTVREKGRTRSKEDRVIEETDWNRDEKSRGKEMLAERIIEIQSPLSCYSLASFPPCRRRKLWKSLPLLLLDSLSPNTFFSARERKRRRKRKRKYPELKKTVHSLEGLIEADQMTTTTMPPRRVRPVE